MGSREDDLYWESKYAEAECYEHGDTMYYDEDAGEWQCFDCDDEDEKTRIFKHG